MYQRIISSLSKSLQSQYGKSRMKNGLAPIDYLILGILSQQTNDINTHFSFKSLKNDFPDYFDVLKASVRKIERSIKHGGLQHKKARLIKKLLKNIWIHHGSFDLGFLKKMGPDEAKKYLTSFKGIGLETACFCLLFGLGIPLMPVDTHVLRVTRRLGLIDPDTGPDETHQFYQEFLEKDQVFNMHANLIELGRNVCRARRTDCNNCVIHPKCRHYLFSSIIEKQSA